MSRHLQVLPVLRSTAAKLRQPAAGKENVEVNTERKGSRRKLEKTVKNKLVENSGENYLKFEIEIVDSDSCKTPKSDKNKIPEALDCPPAPKKVSKRIGYVSCKRKLMPELEFFEVDRRKEVDEFFRSSFKRISEANAKRQHCSDIKVANVVIVGTTGNIRALSTESSSSSSSSRV